MKINTNSNTYTIIYASVVVIVVAFLLSFASSALSPKITANERIDKQKQILSSLGISVPQDQVESTYASTVVRDIIVNDKGEVVDTAGGFEVAIKEISADRLPFYECRVDTTTKYVIPLVGKGLWGTIWGYIAVDADCRTIYGAYFSHESETAGLGALMAVKPFQDEFKGKTLYDKSGAVISVVKFGAKRENPAMQCDGLSGATLTTNGITDMLRDYVGMYSHYLDKISSTNQ